MRLILLTCLTMIAFAANSVLNRMAIDSGAIDPSSFAMIRVLAGAVALCMILTVRGGGLPLFERGRVVGALSLAAYMIGFSLAYVTLDAGLGALILFGTVQVSMFGWSALRGARPTTRQVTGAGIAFAGLLIALWPSDGAGGDMIGALLMVIAGLGWAAYTLAGKGTRDPLSATAANFVVAAPLLAVLLVGTGLHAAPSGIALAILSGAVTSGLGSALWYTVLPQLQGQTAAVVQLSVPVLAIAGGAMLLGEALSLALAMSAALVVGGIAVAVIAPRVQEDHS
ncbi:DMT family transporter [uncultured Tateyamaria sp.]|uniref:DMT family transporter n=1 Tax=uncultured Tateyamaria sp. TaxID=455651 RepID=UPI0026230722|nr:DMT family transporter [uncultured Tateyamaria sp.]